MQFIFFLHFSPKGVHATLKIPSPPKPGTSGITLVKINWGVLKRELVCWYLQAWLFPTHQSKDMNEKFPKFITHLAEQAHTLVGGVSQSSYFPVDERRPVGILPQWVHSS